MHFDFSMVLIYINRVSAGQVHAWWRGEEGVPKQRKQQGQRSEVWGVGLSGNFSSSWSRRYTESVKASCGLKCWIFPTIKSMLQSLKPHCQ